MSISLFWKVEPFPGSEKGEGILPTSGLWQTINVLETKSKFALSLEEFYESSRL